MKWSCRISLLLLSLVLSSCIRGLGVDSENVRVVFDVRNADVKSGYPDDKDAVGSLAVLVFSSESDELLYKEEISGGYAELYLQKNAPLECHFIVNVPAGSFDEVRDIDDLRGSSSLLADNRYRHVMTGHISRSFSSNARINVEVSRLCSRIHVDRLVPLFANETLAASGIIFNGMYLMNVSESIGYLGDIVSSDTEGLSRDMYEHRYDCLVADRTPLRTDAYMYSYSGDSGDSDKSVTMLVLEFTIAGKTNYYSIELPALLPNYEYRIHEIRLHGFGTDEPGEMVDWNALSFTITVNSIDV